MHYVAVKRAEHQAYRGVSDASGHRAPKFPAHQCVAWHLGKIGIIVAHGPTNLTAQGAPWQMRHMGFLLELEGLAVSKGDASGKEGAEWLRVALANEMARIIWVTIMRE